MVRTRNKLQVKGDISGRMNHVILVFFLKNIFDHCTWCFSFYPNPLSAGTQKKKKRENRRVPLSVNKINNAQKN